MADDDMFRWYSMSEVMSLKEHKQALKIERQAWAECHKDRMWLRDKLVRIKRLVDRFDAPPK